MSDNPIQSAERLFHVLETLAQEESMSLTELSVRTGLHKSTVHRLLRSLICLGYAEQDSETSQYQLTYKILALSSACYTKNRLIKRLHPLLKELCAKCHETVHLVKLEGTRILYLDKVESYDHSYQMYSRIGIFNDLYCCATGKALLAAMSDEQILALWPSLGVTQKTPHTITSPELFMKEIRKVRRLGYACDRQEAELGLFSVGAALRDFSGQSQYAVSITAPVSRVTNTVLKHNIALLLEAKKRLSEELGYQAL